MRKSIAYLVLLLLPWVARAQALADWYYWFDTDNAPRQSGKMSGLNAHLQVDASQLETGAHMLYIQVMDTAGVYSPPMGNLFVHVPDASKGSTLRYWFDGSTATYDQPYTQGQHLIDVGKLVPGFHFINYYVLDGHGIGTNVQSAGFYRTPMQSQQRLHYWFAGDSLATQVPDYQNGFMLDVTRLREGFNTIYFQMVENGPTDIESSHFIKIPQTECTGDMTVVCIIDGKVAAEQKLPNAGGVIKWNMDVNNMDVGLHKAMFQVITPSGAGSSIAETYFIRTLSSADIATMQCNYAIDGYRHYSQKGTCDNGSFHLDLPVNEVEDGLHRIDYMLVAENGATTTQGSDWFYKTPLGGNGIKQYDYWINDKSQDVHSETLAKSQDPFQLIKLLPLTQEPIRSSCFQFEVKDDKPMMYAKNDIHFRFHDKSGRWVDADRQYVDYSVSQEVRNIKTLKNEQTFARPDSNEVKWFKFEAEKGDSLAFKCSKAVSMDLFNEKGDLLYNASGISSTTLGGTHATKTGNYYLAIHDAPGTKSGELNLTYEHIDKYALFSTSLAKFGVMPCVQILELDGNGFDNLQSALLQNGEQTIKVDSISCGKKAQARLYMLLNGKEKYGKYDLVLNFDDGESSKSIVKKNYVILEAPSFDEIAIEITDPRAVSDPYPVRFKLTNKSNISYQAVPFYFGLENTDKMSSVEYMDFAVGACRELVEAGLKLSFEFDSFRGNNNKTSIIPVIIPEILPGESRTFTLGVKTGAHQWFKAYGWTGTPWNLKSPETMEFINEYLFKLNKTKSAKAPAIAGVFNGCSDDPCDLAGAFEGIEECACGTVLALGGTLGGIQNALQNRHNQAMRDQLAQSGLFEHPEECFPDQYLPSPADLQWYWIKHCLPGHAGEAASIYDTHRSTFNSDNCSDPEEHTCDAYNPGDPNEIFGYLSDAGSIYICDTISDVSYSIEFENDPKLATASAHKIVVRDTLDANVFDLSSFKPTKIQIGEKVLELNGEQKFTRTIDMRPDINAIAEVGLEYNAKQGIAQWTIKSLDPMSMEETYDIMQGVLPVNNGGNGIGFLNFDIKLKRRLKDGNTFKNQASIIFDYESPIETPVWTNIVDAVAPKSHIVGVVQMNDSTARISLEGSDNRSGVWKYEVYAQHGAGSTWVKAGECTADSGSVDFRFFEGMDYGFCVLATDSAGNVEQKELSREASLGTATKGDVNGDGKIDMVDATLIVNYYLGKPDTYLNALSADTNDDGTIDIVDAIATTKLYMESAPPAHDTPKAARRRRVMKVKNQ